MRLSVLVYNWRIYEAPTGALDDKSAHYPLVLLHPAYRVLSIGSPSTCATTVGKFFFSVVKAPVGCILNQPGLVTVLAEFLASLSDRND